MHSNHTVDRIAALYLGTEADIDALQFKPPGAKEYLDAIHKIEPRNFRCVLVKRALREIADLKSNPITDRIHGYDRPQEEIEHQILRKQYLSEVVNMLKDENKPSAEGSAPVNA